MPKETSAPKTLTEVELEIMTALWALGESSVHGIQEALGTERKLAYTSVSTMLRILESKGVVASRKEGRGHIYFPKLRKEDYESQSVSRMVEKLFGGAPGALVRRLLQTENLSESEIAEIRAILDREGKGK